MKYLNDVTKDCVGKVCKSLNSGDFAVVCKCSNIGEYSAIASSPLRLIIEYSQGRFLDNTGRLWGYAVPCNPKTNLPLIEDVLNEKI